MFAAVVHRSVLRFAVAFALGGAAAAAAGVLGSWIYAPAVGWVVAALAYLAWVWLAIHRLDARGTATHATREDPGRTAADLLTLLATVASFGGVALLLVAAGSAQGLEQEGIVSLALVSVFLSWALVHVVFMLRYAAIYYGDGGGIDFNQDEDPHYGDFAYLAFTIGMTFQVSDTPLRSRALRAAALKHALLSYVFGAIVLASVINLVVGLGR